MLLCGILTEVTLFCHTSLTGPLQQFLEFKEVKSKEVSLSLLFLSPPAPLPRPPALYPFTKTPSSNYYIVPHNSWLSTSTCHIHTLQGASRTLSVTWQCHVCTLKLLTIHGISSNLESCSNTWYVTSSSYFKGRERERSETNKNSDYRSRFRSHCKGLNIAGESLSGSSHHTQPIISRNITSDVQICDVTFPLTVIHRLYNSDLIAVHKYLVLQNMSQSDPLLSTPSHFLPFYPPLSLSLSFSLCLSLSNPSTSKKKSHIFVDVTCRVTSRLTEYYILSLSPPPLSLSPYRPV